MPRRDYTIREGHLAKIQKLLDDPRVTRTEVLVLEGMREKLRGGLDRALSTEQRQALGRLAVELNARPKRKRLEPHPLDLLPRPKRPPCAPQVAR